MMTAMKTLIRLTGGLVAAGLTGLGYASLVERNAYVLRRFEVPLLPAGSPSIKVLHISDMHLAPRQHRKIAWVQDLADLKPDLVVNTGDNLGHRLAIPAALEALQPLLAVPGVFVMGSNDYFSPTRRNPARYLTRSRSQTPTSGPTLPTEQLASAFRDGGWVNLDNARGTLSIHGLRFDFVGVDDPHLKYDSYPTKAAHSAPADVHVGVTHAPYQRILDEMSSEGTDLLIAGHTHGGQLCLPFYGALVTNCDLDRARAKGLSRWWPRAGRTPSTLAPPEASWLEVSAGLGTSPYAPVRFACRPEATLLTLTQRLP